MNIMGLSSAEKRREENIRKIRKFRIEKGVASQKTFIGQDYVK